MPLENGEPTAAEVMAIGNRLLAQKSAPGWYDLVAVGELLKQQARGAVDDYKGADKDELFDLVRRAQIASAFIAEFFGYVDRAIENARQLPGFVTSEPRKEPTELRIAGSH
jgi:hypothetical protein